MEILKEITEWNMQGIPSNHTYLINQKGQIVAFAKWHTNDIQILKSRPYMDKRYRKFVKDNHSELSNLINQFKFEDKTENKTIIKAKNVRVFKIKSNEKEYIINYNTTNKQFNCSCIGFGYRSICKHVNFVKDKFTL